MKLSISSLLVYLGSFNSSIVRQEHVANSELHCKNSSNAVIKLKCDQFSGGAK